MKNLLSTIVMAIVLVSFSVVGCEKKKDAAQNADTTAPAGTTLSVDSTSKGTDVKVEPKSHDFVGTATSVDPKTMMITIKHEKIDDYKDASTSQFKLADSGMIEYVELNTPVDYTVEIVGDQALITGMETADEDDMSDASDTTVKRDTAVLK
jgi:Cu/Ag efflux protein CusF